MAEDKTTKPDSTEKSEGAGAPSTAPATSETAPAAPAAPAAQAKPAPSKGGDYVVIADQVPLVTGTGKDATSTVHKRGARVKLTAGQAATLSAGTRPAVVAAEKVKNGDVTAAARMVLREAVAARSKRRRG